MIADAIAEIARRHRLAGDAARFVDGAKPVFAFGDRVVKLFAAPLAPHLATERDVLLAVEGKLGVPTPRVEAVGEVGDWHYLVMTRLPGMTLRAAWPRLSAEQRQRIAITLGTTLAVLHALPPPSLPCPSGPGLFVRQRQSCVAHQAAEGAPGEWLARIPAFLDGVVLPATSPVLLHTEIMREHVLVEPTTGEVSGLVDFERAMVGPADYEFAAVGLFLAEGDAGVLTALLDAYGMPPDERDRRKPVWMAYALLHRYSNLRWFLERSPPMDATSFAELAARWWPTEPLPSRS